jgi:hypothetical protein
MNRIIVAAIVALVTLSLFAASARSLRGRILGPDEKPLAGVVVVLRNDVTGFKQQSATGPNGEFSFFNVPFNPYVVHVDVQGFQPVHRDVDIHSAVPSPSTAE